jgi:hypothetical protein
LLPLGFSFFLVLFFSCEQVRLSRYDFPWFQFWFALCRLALAAPSARGSELVFISGLVTAWLVAFLIDS